MQLSQFLVHEGEHKNESLFNKISDQELIVEHMDQKSDQSTPIAPISSEMKPVINHTPIMANQKPIDIFEFPKEVVHTASFPFEEDKANDESKDVILNPTIDDISLEEMMAHAPSSDSDRESDHGQIIFDKEAARLAYKKEQSPTQLEVGCDPHNQDMEIEMIIKSHREN